MIFLQSGVGDKESFFLYLDLLQKVCVDSLTKQEKKFSKAVAYSLYIFYIHIKDLNYELNKRYF